MLYRIARLWSSQRPYLLPAAQPLPCAAWKAQLRAAVMRRPRHTDICTIKRKCRLTDRCENASNAVTRYAAH